MIGFGSCGNGNYAVGTDAATDAQAEMTISPPNCKTAGTVCDGRAIHACVGGQAADVLDICPEACSLGRCTTVACADAERQDGTRGCRFYGVQIDNVDSDDAHRLMLILGNASLTTPSTAVVAARDSGGGWETLASATVSPGGGTRIEINRPVLDPGVKTGGAYRVDTDSPVLAIEIISDDVDRTSRSSGGTVLRPLQVLGLTHLALTFPQRSSQGILQAMGSRGGAGAIAVVATATATTVKIGLTTAAILDPGGPTVPRPNPTDVMMNEGDVLQIFSAAPEGDLTGTSIDADAPVAVFSGNAFTTYGYDIRGFNGGDLAMEQLPPTTSWSYEYIGAQLSPQSGCSSFLGAGTSLWSVVAAEDNTDVTLQTAAGVTIEAQGLLAIQSFHLERGGVRTFFARSAPNAAVPTDFVVRSKFKPILLAQWLDCEPSLSWGIDTRFTSQSLAFALPPAFDHEMIVARRRGQPVMFDGRSLEDARFTSTLNNGEFEMARVPASELGACGDLLDPCGHMISGPAFGLAWRGMDVVCSYALTVPPSNVCAPPNITCIK